MSQNYFNPLSNAKLIHVYLFLDVLGPIENQIRGHFWLNLFI